MRLLRLRTQYRFLVDGAWRDLKDQHGAPSGRQLLKLNHAGMLAVASPGTPPR